MSDTSETDREPRRFAVAPEGPWIEIGPRPRKKAFAALKARGLTGCVTLLNESEGAAALGQLARDAGLAWWWHAMAGGNPAKLNPSEFRDRIEAFAAQLRSDASQAVYIHCSAGIHRTGMFTYGALRRFGYDADAARAALSAARPVTGQDVGDQRLAWVEDVLATT